MTSLELSWVIGSGESANGGNMPKATLDDIRRMVQKVLDSSGSVELDVKDGPEVGPVCLQVFHEAGRSVIMLGEDDGEEYDVRTYNRPADDEDESEQVDSKQEVLGNFWDSSTICTDSNIVHAVFQEFFETGNVSTDLLS